MTTHTYVQLQQKRDLEKDDHYVSHLCGCLMTDDIKNSVLAKLRTSASCVWFWTACLSYTVSYLLPTRSSILLR